MVETVLGVTSSQVAIAARALTTLREGTELERMEKAAERTRQIAARAAAMAVYLRKTPGDELVSIRVLASLSAESYYLDRLSVRSWRTTAVIY